MEEFGRNFYRLEGCPHWLAPGEAISYLRDFLEIARENGGKLQIESFARQALERQVNYQQENRGEFSDGQIIDLVDQLLSVAEIPMFVQVVSQFILKFPSEILRLDLRENFDSFRSRTRKLHVKKL